MPRIDAQLPPDELDDIRDRIDSETNAIQWDNSPHQYSPWGHIPSRYQVYRQEEGEQYAYVFGSEYVGPIARLADTTGVICYRCVDRRYTMAGCIRCRPDAWQRCDCGEAYEIGTPCQCWVTCDSCGECGPLPDRIEIYRVSWGDPNYYCDDSCAVAAGYNRCPGWDGDEYDGSECDEWTNHDSGRCGNHRPCTCGNCSRCRDRSNIHSYSYKPSPIFRGLGPLYLGLECEIDVSDVRRKGYSLPDVAQYVNSRMDRERIGYLKSDSSIDHGFELVTHPMSYDWAMGDFPWDMFGELTGTYGVTPDDDCGIHVHVSRDGFSGTRHLYLWQKFFYRNADPIKQLARRDSAQWASFNRDGREFAAYVAKRGGSRGSGVERYDRWYLPSRWRQVGETNFRRYGETYINPPSLARYSAINVQNDATLEVRVFAGSVDAQEVRAALGMVHASVEYTRQLDTASVIKKGGWDWAAFNAWTQTRPEYDSLNREIERLVSA